MGATGQAILALIEAGNNSAANEQLRAAHPDNFVDTVYEAMRRILLSGEATSGSSVTIGTGTKTFTLATAKSWKNGTPVYIMDAAAPSTNVMWGHLSAAEAAGVITVNVTNTKGSGTLTSWTIIAILATSTVVSPPVVEADGGWGASTFAVGRGNAEVPHLLDCAGVTADPGNALSLIGSYTPQRVLVDTGGTGDFSGHDFEIATYNGSIWSFQTIQEPAIVWSRSTNLFYQCQNLGGEGVVDSCTPLTPLVPLLLTTSSSLTVPLAKEYFEQIILATGGGAGITITLLSNADLAGYKWKVIKVDAGAGAVTVNVESAGTINGASTKVLSSQYNSTTIVASASAGAYFVMD